MSEKYKFETQQLYLEMFLNDAETFSRCQNIFDPENFDQRLQETAKFIKEYVDQRQGVPAIEVVNSTCATNFQKLDLQTSDFEWLMDEFERFSRNKAILRAFIKGSDLIESEDYGQMEKLIKDANQVSLNKDMGTDYFADPRSRLEKLKNNNGQISTGWPSIDKKLYGGFNRGELNIFCAASGGGKSLFLANMGVNWTKMGLHVLYLTFELSEGLVGLRLDSMMTGISTREVFKQLDEVELKVKMLEKKSGIRKGYWQGRMINLPQLFTMTGVFGK